MSWSVGAVGTTNVNAAAFEGAALKVMGSILNLPSEFIDHFLQQQKELTSPFPLVGDVQAKFASTSVEAKFDFSPNAVLGNSGKGGLER